MTSLEQTLASVLDAIELAKKTGNSWMLKMFIDRKHAICEALAAPEQCWPEPSAQGSHHVQRQPEQRQSAGVHAPRGKV